MSLIQDHKKRPVQQKVDESLLLFHPILTYPFIQTKINGHGQLHSTEGAPTQLSLALCD